MIDHLEDARRYSNQPLHLYMDVHISSSALKGEVTITNAHIQHTFPMIHWPLKQMLVSQYCLFFRMNGNKGYKRVRQTSCPICGEL